MITMYRQKTILKINNLPLTKIAISVIESLGISIFSLDDWLTSSKVLSNPIWLVSQSAVNFW